MENTENKNSFTAKNRWLAYFDILGFKNLIKNCGAMGACLLCYDSAINNINQNQNDNVHAVWFSDTFLFYADDDSYDSFTRLSRLASGFFYEMFTNLIPMRGCINCGELLAEEETGKYLGQGLIDAYQQSESQQIIGLTMTPDAKNKLNEYSASNKDMASPWALLKKYFWLDYDVPCKTKKDKFYSVSLPIYNLKIDTSAGIDGQRLQDELRLMQHMATMLFDSNNMMPVEGRDKEWEKIRSKYDNTANFLSEVCKTHGDCKDVCDTL
jgi:hypothetical protein